MDLTAGAGECIKVAPDAPDVNDGSLWKRVLRLREEGNLMGAGSPAGSDDNVSAQGIVQGHAYALLAVLEVDGFQLVQLRNPWGDTEWKGAWSDGSREWTPRIMTKVKYVDADDGTFFMEFSDFVHHFEHVYVCRVFDESWLVTTCEAAWAGETAGGCNNTVKIANNPQFLLKLSRPTSVHIVLEQDETRGTGKNELHIGFVVLKLGGKRLTGRYSKRSVVASSGKFINQRFVSAEATLQPDCGEYVVVPSAFDEGDENGFRIRVYSKDAVEFRGPLQPGQGEGLFMF